MWDVILFPLFLHRHKQKDIEGRHSLRDIYSLSEIEKQLLFVYRKELTHFFKLLIRLSYNMTRIQMTAPREAAVEGGGRAEARRPVTSALQCIYLTTFTLCVCVCV